MESISSKIRNKTRAPTLTTVIQHNLEVLVMAIREEKEKRNSNWKRRSKTVTADDMVLYIENPKEATKKLLELISEFGKVEGYKINTEKSLAFVYTNNKGSEREIQKTIPFTIATKIKYLGINQPKQTKELYAENYESLMKEIKDDTNRDIPSSGTGRINIVKMTIQPQVIYRFDAICTAILTSL